MQEINMGVKKFLGFFPLNFFRHPNPFSEHLNVQLSQGTCLTPLWDEFIIPHASAGRSGGFSQQTPGYSPVMGNPSSVAQLAERAAVNR